MAIVDALWGLLTAAGGTLALALIVTLAVGINALMLLFLGSAVVTLERFGRAGNDMRKLLHQFQQFHFFGLLQCPEIGAIRDNRLGTAARDAKNAA